MLIISVHRLMHCWTDVDGFDRRSFLFLSFIQLGIVQYIDFVTVFVTFTEYESCRV